MFVCYIYICLSIPYFCGACSLFYFCFLGKLTVILFGLTKLQFCSVCLFAHYFKERKKKVQLLSTPSRTTCPRGTDAPAVQTSIGYRQSVSPSACQVNTRRWHATPTLFGGNAAAVSWRSPARCLRSAPLELHLTATARLPTRDRSLMHTSSRCTACKKLSSFFTCLFFFYIFIIIIFIPKK